MSSKLNVFAALSEDINSGWVWLPETLCAERTIVRIKCVESGKKIFCEALPIGDNFKQRYDRQKSTLSIADKDKSVVVNEWYRKKLDVQTKQQRSFDIKKSDSTYGKIRASWTHPQTIVRLSMQIAILSLTLGALSIVLSLK